MSAWIQQEKLKYTSIVFSLTWDLAESFLFSPSFHYGLSKCIHRKMHILFQIRLRLIIISFLTDKSPFLGVSLDEVPRPWSANSFKGEAFSSQCSQHYFGIWVSSVSQLRVFSLQQTNGNWLFSIVWKMTTRWLFGGLSLRPNPFCCLTHT